MPSACASPEELMQLLGDALAEARSVEIRAHLTDCPECQAKLDHLSDRPALRRWASSCPSPRKVVSEEPELARLLEKLRAAPPTEAYLGDTRSEMCDTSLTFLAAPAHEGDLGMLGSYRVLAELGRGGMGIVLLAYDSELRRTVALKVLPPGRADDKARARFVREARAAAGLECDHIVPVYAVANPSEGPAYLVMPYVDGPTLAERIKAEGRLDPLAAARVGLQVAQGLAAAHRAGLVHRDIKPANIILDRAQGRAKIMDFGLARVTALPSGITQAGTVLGTPEYMSPEQVRDPDQIDARTDVYSLGVTLYEALTGEVPFRGTAHMILQQVLGEDPRPPRRLNDAIARDLETICLHCMEKERGKRYASAAALAEDLERFLAGKPILARPTTAWDRGVKWARRRPAVAALLGGIILITVLGFAGVTWQWREAVAARRNLADKAKQLEIENYARTIGLAASELDNGNVGRGEELLDQCPPALRDWEWRYLKRHAPPISLPGKRLGTSQADLAFSPNGRSLALPSEEDKGLTLWDVSTRRAVWTSRDHSAAVLRLAFSPDGRLLASGSEDTTVKVRDTATGRKVYTLNGHKGKINSLAFSPDGLLLASASMDNTVKLWNTATRSIVFTFDAKFKLNRFVTMAFSPDGRWLACGSVDNTIKIWHVTTGEEVHILRGHSDLVYNVAFSADGNRLVSTGWDFKVKVWNLATDKEVFSLDSGSSASSLAFSPGWRRLALGGGHLDGTVRIYDGATGELLLTLEGHMGRIPSLCFSPDGRRLASASLDKTVKIWETETGQELLTLRGHKDLVTRVIFDAQGLRLASYSEDGTVKVWDGTPLEEDSDSHVRTLRDHAGIVYCVAFSPDRQHFASASADHSVKLWDAATGRPLQTLLGHTDRVFSLAFGPEGRLATASADKTVKLWDTRTGQVVHTVKFGGAVTSVAWSPDGLLATCATFQTVQLWNATTGQEVHTLKGHTGFVWSVSFSPKEKLVVTAGIDGTVRLWDTTTGQELPGLSREHNTRVNNAVFSPDGNLLASADADGKVIIWDLATRSARHTLPGDGEYVFGLAFSPDSQRLASASWKQVKLWDVKSGHELPPRSQAPAWQRGQLAGTIWSVAFSVDDKWLAGGGGYKGKGEIKLWDVSLWDKTDNK